jgi:predicted amidohydrolase YtcJ
MGQTTLFRGGSIDVAADVAGRILAVGDGAAAAAGSGANEVSLRGTVLPGLHDAHIHLGGLAEGRLGLDLEGCSSRRETLDRVRRHAAALPDGAWLIGRGWYNDAWLDDPGFPDRHLLDDAAGGRPAVLVRKDGHSSWASTAALQAAGAGQATPDPEGGVIDREEGGHPTGILRETAMDLVGRVVPRPSEAELDRAMEATLHDLAALGLTSVHSMDQIEHFQSMQRLHAGGRLPIRITYNIPVAHLDDAARLGIQSGLGDAWLRIWGVKAFLDGSLGSRTAYMLDGSGVALFETAELAELARRCAAARLNICWHAIGDGAVRRALDALEPLAGAWERWRPRIEHAQCVQPEDQPRFRRAGIVASMQPIHAEADRELADREWPEVTPYAYAWRSLEEAGAVLAFGSDAPVESADPLRGLTAATTWRERAAWHPGLALSRESAIRAYTSGAAYAVGMEGELGRLTPGQWCDLAVIENGAATATVVAGEVVWRAA